MNVATTKSAAVLDPPGKRFSIFKRSIMSKNTFLPQPLDAVIFDCDGTLSAIEGIDELAKARDVVDVVAKLTADAMEKTGLSPELYQRRLDLVRPTYEQVNQLGLTYFQQRTPDSLEVIRQLQNLGKSVYIISAGLYPAVAIFSELLQVPLQNIFAVNISFADDGNYADFDHYSPLVQADGKRQIVHMLQQQHGKIAYVGDGLNDYSVYDLVTRFIGYGGAFYREKFAKCSEFYLTEPTLKPVLPLCLTREEFDHLSLKDQSLLNLF